MILWLWFLSVFPLAFIFKSKAINWLSIILFICAFCSMYAYWDYDWGLIWTIYMPFIIGSILYSAGNTNIVQEKYTAFAVSYKLTALLPMFITFLILIFSVENSYHITKYNYIIPPVLIILFNAVNFVLNKNKNDFFKAEAAFLIAVPLFMLILMLVPSVNILSVTIAAHLFIIYLIWGGFSFGYKYENVSLINLTNLMLIIYVLSTYCRFAWSFMDKTLFFFVGGAALISLGIFLEKHKKNTIKKFKKEE